MRSDDKQLAEGTYAEEATLWRLFAHGVESSSAL